MIVMTSAGVEAQPAADTPLSPTAYFNRRIVEWMIRDFLTSLCDSIQMVLDAASPFQRRLTLAEKDVEGLTSLPS
ncbi:uncharacterized protein A4U43_C10F10500 [Asparagus officinalis]|uniref:Uncharacterized protein n=1 Tax=Asparagus officinalis TaxID=4686 RepID=A0A5P1E6H4_ASPOF|nr:uncharacterized protein A4U43_C10F10500 [Asparagus officinalis]